VADLTLEPAGRAATTLAGALAAAAAHLGAAGIAEPRREALRIWAGLAGAAPARALADAAAVRLDPIEAAAFLAAAERRARGEPLAYVTGRAGFRHLELAADRRALIPRPETEGLVELVLGRAQGGDVADIGTGTGCIALSLATEGGCRRVVAVDCSDAALALARANAAALRVELALVRGDLTHALAAGSLDALVSNPPYLSAAEYAALDPSVRDWEPALALQSGPDGFAATEALLDDGQRVLRPRGWIALELDASRAAEAARRASALGWADVAIHHDLFGRERYLLARRNDA
jgi:release factor glutamine methyltransferase